MRFETFTVFARFSAFKKEQSSRMADRDSREHRAGLVLIFKIQLHSDRQEQ
jgi:hypothetical protein